MLYKVLWSEKARNYLLSINLDIALNLELKIYKLVHLVQIMDLIIQISEANNSWKDVKEMTRFLDQALNSLANGRFAKKGELYQYVDDEVSILYKVDKINRILIISRIYDPINSTKQKIKNDRGI